MPRNRLIHKGFYVYEIMRFVDALHNQWGQY